MEPAPGQADFLITREVIQEIQQAFDDWVDCTQEVCGLPPVESLVAKLLPIFERVSRSASLMPKSCTDCGLYKGGDAV